MSNRLLNYSGIFKWFEYNKPDKTGTVLTKLGKICFTLSFIGAVLTSVFRGIFGDSLQIDIAVGLWGIGFLVGVFMFIATGIHYFGHEKSKANFLSSTVHVLKNTFLYLFLPSIIMAAILIFVSIKTQ